MAAAGVLADVSVEEYLRAAYEPDRDYVDGKLEERHSGEFEHSRLQGLVYAWLFAHEEEWQILALPEQRVQVAPTRFRVPDICIVGQDQTLERVIHQPPIACIEILSPTDSLGSMQERVDDYYAMGVRNVWLLDPLTRIGYVGTPQGFAQPQGGRFQVANTEIHIVPADLFSRLPRLPA